LVFIDPLLPVLIPDQETEPGAPVLTRIEPSVPLHELGSVGVNVITGVGFMEIVKVKGALVHPFRVAVAEIVPLIALVVLLDPKLKGVI
jgi:hypothetical protein